MGWIYPPIPLGFGTPGRGPYHKLHAMTSSETLKEEFFAGQRYRNMEDQKPRPGVGTKLGSRSIRERAQTNRKKVKTSNLEDVLSEV